MKYVDEFRDAAAVERLIAQIRNCATRRHVIMEVCGGQTHSLLRYGLDVTSRLRELHQGITPYFRQAWRSASKDAKMKVAEALASPGGIPRALDGPGLEHTSRFHAG